VKRPAIASTYPRRSGSAREVGNEAAAGDRAGHGGGGVALDRTEALGARMQTIDEEENEWTL
jgi:hypothetical protein